MRSMSVGMEPIAAASLYSAPQAVSSDGSFAQSLQDTVDMGSAASPQPQQPAQSGELQQAQESVQPQENLQPQENVQAAPESQPQENSQVVQEAQTQEVQEVQQPEKVTYGFAAQKTEGGHFQFEVEWDDPNSDLMKELEDLLGKTEDMLAAPERMKETIKSMIAQAYEELSDPEVSEEEFTEMVLEFLLKFIDEKFGGERDDSSIVGDKDDDEINVNDVLMQVVVQMLENIRSENAQTEQQPETEETVDGIPSAEAIDETAAVTDIEPLTDESQLRHIPEEIAYQSDEAYIDVPETEAVQEAPQVQEIEDTAETVPEEVTEALPEEQTTEKEQTVDIYQVAMQTAENIYNAIIKSVQPKQPEAENKTGSESTVFPVEPTDELDELNQLIKGGESVKSEEPELDLSSGQEQETEPTVILDAAGETVPFETAIASAAPQVTLTGAVEGSGAERVVAQIASEIFNQLPENGGTTTFVMTLNPESLGKVTVKLVEEAGKISVSVTAHNKQTAEMLSQRFDTLQAAMKENGTELEKYQVVYEPEQSEGSAQQNFDGSSKNPYVKQDDEEGENSGEFAEILQQAV